jgi:hypothetical protein
LTFYWDAESEVARGGVGLSKSIAGESNYTPQITDEKKITKSKSVTIDSNGDVYRFGVNNGDLIDKDKGSVSFWFYPTTSATNRLFRMYIDENNYFNVSEQDNSGNTRIITRWEYGGSSEYGYGNSGEIHLNAWNYVRVTWDTDKGEHRVYVNGIPSNTIENAYAMTGEVTRIAIGDDTFDFSSQVYIDQIFITNNPYTEEIPTAFGKPINMPQMYVDETRQNFGYDYVASWTADMNSVVIQYMKDVSTSQIFEIGDSYGSAQPTRIRGGVRIEGGVRF